jgi:Ala-tRNA(Pro) deacylase
MTIATTVKDYLDKNQIAYQLIDHPKSYTSSEIAAAAHVADDHIAKGVLLNDDHGFLLAIVPADQWLNFDRLRDELDRELQLSTEEDVEAVFMDCDPGAVPPFGEAYGLESILDDALTSLAKVYVEAGDHQQLVVLSSEQFLSLMQGVRHGHFCDIH